MSSGGTAIDVALSTLAAFLRTTIPALTVEEEWPYANEQLTYPNLTLSTTNPKRTPEMPYQLSVTTPDVNGQVVATESVAKWDDVFQMDLWTSDKDQRKYFTDLIIQAFNSQEVDATGDNKPDGLTLVSIGNFSETVRYEIDTAKCVDDEAAAQRQERRTLFKVLVNCREVRQRTYYAIKTIGIYQQTTVNEITDDQTGTELKTIQ